ncbi:MULTISPECIES: hypothetical protein [Pseudofrankia]|uniref:hypothetical protein n=1 Tax=Pseudofrankia TaxID=2994363 RepID=UPI0002FF5577|nr:MULTISPECIES: hypothetical protein [Pseudofrankia]OHV33364.1 hypothetical protein BCD49_27235 [Pseudofrankia sp. EUN1h]
MDTSRAHELLGWRPAHEAGSILREWLTGAAAGTGRATPVLRPVNRPGDQVAGAARAIRGDSAGRV